MTTINHPVKYKSQWDADAVLSANDCGPCSIAMILNYYGENVTTDEVFKRTGAGSGLIGIAEMQKAIASYGYTSERKVGQTPSDIYGQLQKNQPVIALVHYGSLTSTQDKTFRGGHFFVVVGMRDDGYFVNDPNFKGALRQDGDHHFFTKAEFEKAWKDCTLDGNQPNSFIVINRKTPVAPVAQTYKGIDLTNLDSVKVCVDTWSDVVSGAYVKKDELVNAQAESQSLYNETQRLSALVNELKAELSGEKKASEAIKKELQSAIDQIASALGSTADLPGILKFIQIDSEELEQLRKKAKQLENDLSAAEASKAEEISQLKREIEDLRQVNAKQAEHIERLETRINNLEVNTEALQPVWNRIVDFINSVLIKRKD